MEQWRAATPNGTEDMQMENLEAFYNGVESGHCFPPIEIGRDPPHSMAFSCASDNDDVIITLSSKESSATAATSTLVVRGLAVVVACYAAAWL